MLFTKNLKLGKSIKKVLLGSTVALGLLTFGGMVSQGNQVNVHADSVTTSWGNHFDTRTIHYHISASSKKYRNVWAEAINRWNNEQSTLKFVNSSYKKANLRLTTNTNKHVTQTISGSDVDNTSINSYHDITMFINRLHVNHYDSNNEQIMNYAMSAIGNGVGLDYNHNDKSIMSYNGATHLSQGDKLGLVKMYKHVKY